MLSDSISYDEMFEDYETEDELNQVISALEEEGYEFTDRRGIREPDLSDDPGVNVPYFGDLKFPGNLRDGLYKMLEASGVPDITRTSFVINGADGEGEKLYALSEKDYETLTEVTEEVLEK